jgi:hypothetical protein
MKLPQRNKFAPKQSDEAFVEKQLAVIDKNVSAVALRPFSNYWRKRH